jgi:hypothetical protein
LLFGSTPLTLGVYGSKALQAAVDRVAQDFDVGYAYSSSMGAFLEPHARLKRVMHFAELDSDKWRQYAERAQLADELGLRARAPHVARVRAPHRQELRRERASARRSSSGSSKREIPGARSLVLRNGVDLAFYRPKPARRAEPSRVHRRDGLPAERRRLRVVRERDPAARARALP